MFAEDIANTVVAMSRRLIPCLRFLSLILCPCPCLRIAELRRRPHLSFRVGSGGVVRPLERHETQRADGAKVDAQPYCQDRAVIPGLIHDFAYRYDYLWALTGNGEAYK